MAWIDVPETEGQNLDDSEAFSTLGHDFRGKATKKDLPDFDVSPPASVRSESFFKAAGCEVVEVEFAGTTSARRQIMNQSDVFYFSGHGSHDANQLQGRLTPAMAQGRWNRDLDVAIIAGCSVLDINDYNNNYSGTSHALSPGKAWERTGPGILLGYAYVAPGDAGGASTRIINQWRTNRAASGDVNAWMDANAANRSWNACAIVKGLKYVYFKRSLNGWINFKREVRKENW